jgi:hypothetical protein
MRWLVQIVILCLLPVLFVGCENQKNNSQEAQTVKHDLVLTFPAALSGTWERQDGEWEIVFTEDGRLDSAIMPLSKSRIWPHKTTEVSGRRGEPGFYQVGDCPVIYQPDDGSIIIEINIERVYAELAGGIVDGPYTFLINGRVHKDFKSWDALVYSIPDLDVFMPDPNSDPNNPVYVKIGRFDIDPNNLEYEGKQVLFVRPEEE